MVQVRKEEISERILDVALQSFALQGFPLTTMAGIARTAGISTGNVYRYFQHKDALFEAILPPDFVQGFQELLTKRVKAMDGVDDLFDLFDLGQDSSFHRAAEALFEFCFLNRWRVIILLSKTAGTRYEGFDDATVRMLVDMAVEHFRASALTETMRFNLDRIYRSYVQSWAALLAAFEEEATLRQAIEEYSRYHLVGLKALFSSVPRC